MNSATFFVCCLLVSISRAEFIDWCSPIAHKDPQTQIAYGNTTEKGEIRYQVQVRWYGDFVCGGTLIKVGPEEKQAILTAASCINGPDPFFYSFQAGDWDLDNYFDNEQVREVDQVYFPDNYNKSRPYENDIALITLRNAFDLDNMTEPISLPPAEEALNPNQTLLASGWGSWHPILDELTCRLQKVEMPQVERSECQRVYLDQRIVITDSMFCIGKMDGEEDSTGAVIGPSDVDFGGPLVDVEAGYLVGIMSHNFRSARVGYPALSTKVSPYVNWIEEKMNVRTAVQN